MTGQLNQRKIPTLLAVAILAGMSVLLAGVNQVTSLFSRASTPPSAVENFLVSNVTDSSWTVSWTTPEATSGVVYYGRDSNASDGVAIDERNASSPNKLQRLHVVTVRGNRPGVYYFKLAVNSTKMGQIGDLAYQVLLPSQLSGASGKPIVAGKVKDATGNSSAGSLVVLKIAGAQVLSAPTGSDGSFSFSLSGLRSRGLETLFTPQAGTEEIVSILDESLGQTTVNCQVGLEENLNNIVLGQGANCPGVNVSLSEPTSNPSVVVSPSPTVPVTGVNRFKSVKINSGKTVLGASSNRKVLGVQARGPVVDPLPTISGEALPGQMVNIKVDTGVSQVSVRTGTDGRWHWLPSTPLGEGSHTILITTVNKDGTSETQKRQIVVSSALSVMPQVLGTPSAVISPPVVTPPPVSTPAAQPTPPVAPPPPTGTGDYTLMMLALGLLVFIGAGTIGFGKFSLD